MCGYAANKDFFRFIFASVFLEITNGNDNDKIISRIFIQNYLS